MICLPHLQGRPLHAAIRDLFTAWLYSIHAATPFTAREPRRLSFPLITPPPTSKGQSPPPRDAARYLGFVAFADSTLGEATDDDEIPWQT